MPFNETDRYNTKDPNCKYFNEHGVFTKPGIPGLRSGKFWGA